jgi:hypothetical protein
MMVTVGPSVGVPVGVDAPTTAHGIISHARLGDVHFKTVYVMIVSWMIGEQQQYSWQVWEVTQVDFILGGAP